LLLFEVFSLKSELHLERIKIKLVENQNLALKFEQKNTSSRLALQLLKRQ